MDSQDISVHFEFLIDLLYLIFKHFHFRGLCVECKNLPHLVSVAENNLSRVVPTQQKVSFVRSWQYLPGDSINTAIIIFHCSPVLPQRLSCVEMLTGFRTFQGFVISNY